MWTLKKHNQKYIIRLINRVYTHHLFWILPTVSIVYPSPAALIAPTPNPAEGIHRARSQKRRRAVQKGNDYRNSVPHFRRIGESHLA